MKELEKYIEKRISELKKEMNKANVDVHFWWYCYGKILAFKSILRKIKEGDL